MTNDSTQNSCVARFVPFSMVKFAIRPLKVSFGSLFALETNGEIQEGGDAARPEVTGDPAEAS